MEGAPPEPALSKAQGAPSFAHHTEYTPTGGLCLCGVPQDLRPRRPLLLRLVAGVAYWLYTTADQAERSAQCIEFWYCMGRT